MSVSRKITIRFATNYCTFSNLFYDFAIDNWFNNTKQNVQSLKKDDVEDFDFITFNNFEILKPILDYRENKNISNYISLFVEDFEESILLNCIKIDQNYINYQAQYEWTITPCIGKRIKFAERYTDFGFYLNQIIPKLLKLNCYICEINCQDFDS